MKADVKCRCGHTITMTLYGTNVHGEQDRKIKWQEEHDCPDCYHKAQVAEGKEQEVRVKYSDYKNDERYMDCKTKADSYDKSTKTIVVYVPIEQPAEEEAESAPEEPKEELAEETVKELAEEFGLKAAHIRAFAKQGSAKMMEDLNQMLDQTVKSDKFKEDVAINLFKLIIKLKSVGI